MALTDKELIQAATEAREKAYCRYSKYSVGAAIIDEDGRLHVGCNVENASYNLGNCAEAAAIAAMVQAGGKRIHRIAVAGGFADIGPCTPCGGCRQRINEFADQDTAILVIDDSQEWQEYSIDDLLPASFHLDEL
ncbi:MAG: cytidine deaminase [Gammaproteobacteria bacterium]|nr:cytidine deaminase [Gammaproteobacteria bacterium]